MSVLPEVVSVDVITVGFNGGSMLERSLASLQESVGVRVRSIVVDNASSDASADAAAHLGAEVTSLHENVGYGAALNVGLRIGTAEWVACANQDVEVSPTAIRTLVDSAIAYEGETGVPCVVAPLLLTPDGRPAETCHTFPSFGRQVFAFLAGERAGGCRNVLPVGADPQPCDWVSAAFILGRRETFDGVGGFDDRFFMYVEDLDFFSRLSAKGGQCVWVPGAAVTHHGGATHPCPPALYAHSLYNWRQYYVVRGRRARGAVILASGVAGSLLRGGVWTVRSLGGDAEARAYARMFFGAVIALFGLFGLRSPLRSGRSRTVP